MAVVNWSLQHFSDTAANMTANNPVLLEGQIGIETDGLTTTPKFKIGDGSTAWNTLPYFYGGALSAQNLSNVLSVGNTTGNNDIIQTGSSVFRNNDSTCFFDLATSNFLELYSTDGSYKYHLDSDSTLQYVEMKTEDIATQSELSYFQSIPLQTNIGVFSGATGNKLTQLEITNGEIKTNIVNNLTFEGIKYNADFSANYTNRSLVDKGYVDGQLSSYLTTSAAALAYQPLDSDLTSWSGVTRAAGFDTFVATPSSANLASLVTDETGSGALVFGTQPTFTQWITVPRIYGGTGVTDGIDFYSTSGNGTAGSVAHRFRGGNNGAVTILEMFNNGNFRIPNNRTILATDSGGTDRSLLVWSSGDNITINGRPGTTDIVLNPTSGGIGLYVKSGGDGGIGVASPVARWHIIKTSEQLRVGYDTSNYFSTTVSSVGNTTFTLTGTSPTFTFNNSIRVAATDLQVGTGTMIGSLRGLEISYTNNNANLYMRNNSTSLKSILLIGDATYAKSVRFQYVGSTFASSGIEQADSSNLFSVGNKLNIGTYGAHDLTFWSNNTQRGSLTTNGSWNLQNGALATTATNGFVYLPSCAGIPTGVPTAISGGIPFIVDSTNNRAYIYSGGAWVALN